MSELRAMFDGRKFIIILVERLKKTRLHHLNWLKKFKKWKNCCAK